MTNSIVLIFNFKLTKRELTRRRWTSSMFQSYNRKIWSSHLEVFLGKGVLKICSQFTGKHPCWRVISVKLLCKFIEIALRDGCSLVNSLHIFRTHFLKDTSDGCFWKTKLIYFRKLKNIVNLVEWCCGMQDTTPKISFMAPLIASMLKIFCKQVFITQCFQLLHQKVRSVRNYCVFYL